MSTDFNLTVLSRQSCQSAKVLLRGDTELGSCCLVSHLIVRTLIEFKIYFFLLYKSKQAVIFVYVYTEWRVPQIFEYSLTEPTNQSANPLEGDKPFKVRWSIYFIFMLVVPGRAQKAAKKGHILISQTSELPHPHPLLMALVELASMI